MNIIISRYNENTSWSDSLENVIIFNKGEGDSNKLPNVGREGHTYYHFILSNYDNLQYSHYCFLQGFPFDHSPNILENIKNLDLSNNSKYISLCEKFYITDLLQSPIKFTEEFRKMYFNLFNVSEMKDEFVFGAGAQFIVSREAILV